MAHLGLANLMVPAVEIMPIGRLVAMTLLHQLLFIALPVAIIAVPWARAGSSAAKPTGVTG